MSITPCGVVYQVLSDFTGKRRYDAIDTYLISREPWDKNGRSPYDRVTTTGTFRTREIIQKDPSALDPALFKRLPKPAFELVSFFKHEGYSTTAIVNYFSGEASSLMAQSLKDWGFDHYAYENTMADVSRSGEASNADVALAVLILFLATGFYGDSHKAISVAMPIIRTNCPSVSLATSLLNEDGPQQSVFQDQLPRYERLALARRYANGSIDPNLHVLSTGEEGTIIGRAGTEDNSLNNVDSTVSRRHLLVYRSNGRWLARGLGSTNGSWVERPDGTVEVIESPAKARSRQERFEVELFPDDVLKLGKGTEFVVMAVN